MGDSARIRCTVGAVLPRAGMSAAKSQEKSKRNKATLRCFLPSGQPTFEAFPAGRRPVQFLDVLPRSCQDGSRFSVTAREHACSTSPGEWQLRRRALSRRSRSPQTLKPGAENGETRSSPRRRKIQNRRSSHTRARGGGRLETYLSNDGNSLPRSFCPFDLILYYGYGGQAIRRR